MRSSNYLSVFLLGILLVAGCKKSDRFYNELQDLPQLELSTYGYKPAYAVGDTMIIAGRLNPANGLKITIGDTVAVIAQTSRLEYPAPSNQSDSFLIDQVKVLITAGMGIGANRTVSISSGGQTIQGPSIEIYTTGGPGSLTDSLKLVQYYPLPDANEVFFYAVNGKGSIYFYDNGSIQTIQKGGVLRTLLSAADFKDSNGPFSITTFYAGGVNPQETQLYFSALTNTGYRLCSYNMANKSLTTLNITTPAGILYAIGTPYEGAVGSVKCIVDGIYPDSSGNMYLTLIGDPAGQIPSAELFPEPYAIARLTAGGNVKYVFKLASNSTVPLPESPGITIPRGIGGEEGVSPYRFQPDDNTLYCFTGLNNGSQIFGSISVYDLTAGIQLSNFSTIRQGTGIEWDNLPQLIGPFNAVKFELIWSNGANQGFGFMPLSGERMVTLFYQYLPGFANTNAAAQNGLPVWGVFDFGNSRIYQYAPGRLDIGTYHLQPTDDGNYNAKISDELLNYDENGQLYMSANGGTVLVKTENK